jgi:nucleoid-associated protein YgaU
MIYSDSRYAEGNIFRSFKKANNSYEAVVTRVFPTQTVEYFTHVWTVNDRLDLLAIRFYGDAEKWWRILDFNPEIPNPTSIVPGTVLRIPSAG